MIRWVPLKVLICALSLLAGPAVDEAGAAAPPEEPTRVAASFFFNTVENVDSVNETFSADFYLLLSWQDPRLVGLPPEQIQAGGNWEPRVEVVNSRDLERPWEPYFKPIGRDEVGLSGRFFGTFAAPMDLHDFPFDRQVLPVEIESLLYPAETVVFNHPQNRREARGWSTPLKVEEVLGSGARLPEWKVEAVQVRELDSYYGFVDENYSRYRIEILVARRAGFYVWKVIVIEAMIVVLSWVVFLLGADDLGNRSTVSVTLLLATVAFSYVVGGITPRISYLTLLDWFLLGCFALIFLSSLETVAVYVLQRRGKSSAVTARIDHWALAVFPILFLLMNVVLWVPVMA